MQDSLNVDTSLRKNLRSRSRLTGDIREYCLSNTRMPLSNAAMEEDSDFESEALNEMLQKITGDKNKLTKLLVKNLMKNQSKLDIFVFDEMITNSGMIES